jgi:hypothetical protein
VAFLLRTARTMSTIYSFGSICDCLGT